MRRCLRRKFETFYAGEIRNTNAPGPSLEPDAAARDAKSHPETAAPQLLWRDRYTVGHRNRNRFEVWTKSEAHVIVARVLEAMDTEGTAILMKTTFASWCP